MKAGRVKVAILLITHIISLWVTQKLDSAIFENIVNPKAAHIKMV